MKYNHNTRDSLHFSVQHRSIKHIKAELPLLRFQFIQCCVPCIGFGENLGYSSGNGLEAQNGIFQKAKRPAV